MVCPTRLLVTGIRVYDIVVHKEFQELMLQLMSFMHFLDCESKAYLLLQKCNASAGLKDFEKVNVFLILM